MMRGMSGVGELDTLLDIGSGGGILTESMARLGARVTGIEFTTAVQTWS
jgi:2-polyprenyl-3-methyl-5-hydroxy-6-metoxy-1,4-benzoquinol methylase